MATEGLNYGTIRKHGVNVTIKNIENVLENIYDLEITKVSDTIYEYSEYPVKDAYKKVLQISKNIKLSKSIIVAKTDPGTYIMSYLIRAAFQDMTIDNTTFDDLLYFLKSDLMTTKNIFDVFNRLSYAINNSDKILFEITRDRYSEYPMYFKNILYSNSNKFRSREIYWLGLYLLGKKVPYSKIDRMIHISFSWHARVRLLDIVNYAIDMKYDLRQIILDDGNINEEVLLLWRLRE